MQSKSGSKATQAFGIFTVHLSWQRLAAISMLKQTGNTLFFPLEWCSTAIHVIIGVEGRADMYLLQTQTPSGAFFTVPLQEHGC